MTATSMSTHLCDHRIPKPAEGEEAPRTPGDMQAARLRNCPVHRRHDHTNTDPYAYDKDRQPVPAWWFTCPICGGPDAVAYVHLWTKAGIAWSNTQQEPAA